MHHCTICHSANVRRSGASPGEAHLHPFKSPYRCQECDARFWVLSRRTKWGAAASGVIALFIVAAVAAPVLWRQHVYPAVTPPDARVPLTGSNATPSTEQSRLDDILRMQSTMVDAQLEFRARGARP